jgi:prolyl oligopeptidase
MIRVLFLIWVFALSHTSFAESEEETLKELIDSHWQWVVDSSPEYAVFMGDIVRASEWDDVSLEQQAENDAQLAVFEQTLKSIDSNNLSEASALNQRLLLAQIQRQRERYALGFNLVEITMRGGPQSLFTVTETLPFRTEADYERWLQRLAALPARLEQEQAILQAGVDRGIVQARVIMQRIPGQLAKITQVDTLENPFYKPFLDFPEGIDPAKAQMLSERGARAIEDHVGPSYRKFEQFFNEVYLPASRVEVGIGALQSGREMYESAARRFTTTSLSPEQIHQIGLDEVARIRGEMEELIQELGFDGDLQDFNDYLRTAPKFYYESPEALFEGYLAVSKRLDPELVKLFGRLPRMPYGVRAIPEQIAPDTTTAYYMRPAADGSRAGYYYVNLYRPEVRPKYEMEVLSVHEAVPGHHLQIALAQELEGLPTFRKLSGPTAFIEGWGLYSERLGYDMGLYRDPYSRYGQLIYDMWRAVRLVVDTGMHYMGWTREQAIEYFKNNAAKTEADIINEIDRYIGWPGQALAYKIGQLKILELRSRAEQRLGDRFDIRAFHDHLLGAGALPLDVLEERMDRWLASQ